MDDVIEAIEEQLSWRIEDEGIGHYEFWGTDYYDQDLTAVLETDKVYINFPSVRN